uniref:Tumor protein, translationally-controlled 1 n=1 Tax=Gallus gallus TaxID=9031 RepID=A0A8V0XJJ9_CHICK
MLSTKPFTNDVSQHRNGPCCRGTACELIVLEYMEPGSMQELPERKKKKQTGRDVLGHLQDPRGGERPVPGSGGEGPEGEGTEATVITGVDIVINHHLQETSFTKESYKKYIKDYMKAIKARLEEHKPERVKPFMTGAAEQIKHILANFKNYQFFVGENMNPDGMVALLDFREDGVTPYMIFFKDGLEIEKC